MLSVVLVYKASGLYPPYNLNRKHCVCRESLFQGDWQEPSGWHFPIGISSPLIYSSSTYSPDSMLGPPSLHSRLWEVWKWVSPGKKGLELSQDVYSLLKFEAVLGVILEKPSLCGRPEYWRSQRQLFWSPTILPRARNVTLLHAFLLDRRQQWCEIKSCVFRMPYSWPKTWPHWELQSLTTLKYHFPKSPRDNLENKCCCLGKMSLSFKL